MVLKWEIYEREGQEVSLSESNNKREIYFCVEMTRSELYSQHQMK